MHIIVYKNCFLRHWILNYNMLLRYMYVQNTFYHYILTSCSLVFLINFLDFNIYQKKNYFKICSRVCSLFRAVTQCSNRWSELRLVTIIILWHKCIFPRSGHYICIIIIFYCNNTVNSEIAHRYPHPNICIVILLT